MTTHKDKKQNKHFPNFRSKQSICGCNNIISCVVRNCSVAEAVAKKNSARRRLRFHLLLLKSPERWPTRDLLIVVPVHVIFKLFDLKDTP